MEGSLTPLEKARKGMAQVVTIPKKVILLKVMESLKSPSIPVFSLEEVQVIVNESTNRTVTSYKASVQIDVTTCLYANGARQDVPKLCGDRCNSVAEAEESACERAFEYLATYHNVFVVDNSSKIAKKIYSQDTIKKAKLVSDAVEKSIAAWDESVHNLARLKGSLERKKFRETSNGTLTASGLFFEEVENYIANDIKEASMSLKYVQEGWYLFEEDRIGLKAEIEQRLAEFDAEAGKQPGYYTGKNLLEYLLCYFGFPAPTYECEVKGGFYEGIVRIDFPLIEIAGCGGILLFRGYSMRSFSLAHENAADEAIEFMKSKLKIEVDDCNYCAQEDARRAEGKIVFVLKHFLDFANKVLVQFPAFLESLDAACKLYGEGVHGVARFRTPPAELYAIDFGSEQLQSIREKAKINFKKVEGLLKEVEKYYP